MTRRVTRAWQPQERRPTAPSTARLVQALPQTVWAPWCEEQRRTATLHLPFDLLKGITQRPGLTAGQTSETRSLERELVPGRLHIADRATATMVWSTF